MYLIQASPMTKIFLPEHQEKCLADPEYVFNGDPFTVRVKRSCGNVILVHGKPVHAATLMPTGTKRQIEEDEVTPLYDWLTDERNGETDMYGIVGVQIQENVSDAIMALIAEGTGTKNMGSLIKDVQKKLTGSIKSARERADLRVRNHCKNMYNTVKETWDYMQREGKGVYSPSYSESLAMEIMKKEILHRTAPSKVSQAKFSETMNELNHQVN